MIKPTAVPIDPTGILPEFVIPVYQPETMTERPLASKREPTLPAMMGIPPRPAPSVEPEEPKKRPSSVESAVDRPTVIEPAKRPSTGQHAGRKSKPDKIKTGWIEWVKSKSKKNPGVRFAYRRWRYDDGKLANRVRISEIEEISQRKYNAIKRKQANKRSRKRKR